MGMDPVESGAVHDLGAVVICKGGPRRLVATLDSLVEKADGVRVDLLVVEDDVGRGSSEDRLRREPALRHRGRGFAQACNRGLEASSARYALFVETGVELGSGSLRALVSALDARPDVGLAGVRELRPDGSLAPTIRRFPSVLHLLADALGAASVPGVRRLLGERRMGARAYERQTWCDWTAGSLLVVRRAALESAGWFDERLLPYAARADLCWRMRRTGWRVAHMPQLTTMQRADVNRSAEAEIAYARMQFARKHLPLAAGGHRWALLFRYGLRVAADSLPGRKAAATAAGSRAALSTVLSGTAPLGGGSALQ
jgi:hypothetical protein